VGCAWEIFHLDFFTTIDEKEKVPIQCFPNGSPVPPQKNDLLIWKRELRGTGHVAVVTDVNEDRYDLKCSVTYYT
jgi:hypothetical protein